MENSSNDILLTPEEQKEARRKLERMGPWANEPFECEVCHGMFTNGEPCPEHWIEIREKRITVVIEHQRKLDDDFANADNPDKDPYNLKDIAARLYRSGFLKDI